MNFRTRMRFAWGVLCGRYAFPAQLEDMQFMADLAKTAAALTALSDSTDRLIAQSQNNATAAASATAALADADDQTSATVSAIGAKIDAVAPPPAPDDKAIDPATGLPVA